MIPDKADGEAYSEWVTAVSRHGSPALSHPVGRRLRRTPGSTVNGGGTLNTFTCSRCGHAQEVESITTPDGRNVPVEEYMTALAVAGMVLVCDSCLPFPGNEDDQGVWDGGV
jgi:hypothetical protein